MSVTAASRSASIPASYCAEGCKTTSPRPTSTAPATRRSPTTASGPAMLLAGGGVERQAVDRSRPALRRELARRQGLLMNTSEGPQRRAPKLRARAARCSARRIRSTGRCRRASKAGPTSCSSSRRSPRSTRCEQPILDGAIADHLTSFGGALIGYDQTTALDWLSPGATGSYGTSTEPCSFRAKFPDVGVAMAHYLIGRDADRGVLEKCPHAGPGRLRRRSAGAAVRRRSRQPLGRRHRGLDARAAARQLPLRGGAQQHRTVPGDPCRPRRRLRRSPADAAGGRHALFPRAQRPAAGACSVRRRHRLPQRRRAWRRADRNAQRRGKRATRARCRARR